MKKEEIELFKLEFYNKNNEKQPGKDKLHFHEKQAKTISDSNMTFSEFININIRKSVEEDDYINWVKHLGSTITEMSEIFSKFKTLKSKDTKDIKTSFNSLRYYYSEVIENLRRIPIHKSVLYLLDDIFLRIFKWEEKRQTTCSDSVLLRNAFSHFNIVYDKQSLISAGSIFRNIFIKKYSLAQFKDLEDNLAEGYSSIEQRIILYNSTGDDPKLANALLDTTCIQLCRYFMTFCHSLYAIHTNSMVKVPFSEKLLGEFQKIYYLDLLLLNHEKPVKNNIDTVDLSENTKITVKCRSNDGSIIEANETCKELNMKEINEATIPGGSATLKCLSEVSIYCVPESDHSLLEQKPSIYLIKTGIMEKVECYRVSNNEIVVKSKDEIIINNDKIIVRTGSSISLKGNFIVQFSGVNDDKAMTDEIKQKLDNIIDYKAKKNVV